MAALVVAGALVFFLWPGPDLRAGSEELADGPVDVASRTPSSYRIVYRSEAHAGGDVVVSTDRVWVRRPFEARVETRSGPPPGEQRVNVTVNAFAHLQSPSATFAIAPGAAGPDRRPDVVLREAEREGYAQARERRRVAGRVCRVYRMAGESASGALPLLEAETDAFTDVCFDEAGLALEEVTFVDGRVLLRRVAVEVEEEPSRLPDSLFETGEPTGDVRQGGGSVRELLPSSRPPGESFWELPEPPRGFEHEGRYTVIPPQHGFDDPLERGRIVVFTTDVWVEGLDVMVVEQGATLQGHDPFAADPNARRVRVAQLGEGELIYGLNSNEVRVLLGGGRFVRVAGTVSASRLLAAARSLEETEGGELVYLDELPN